MKLAATAQTSPISNPASGPRRPSEQAQAELPTDIVYFSAGRPVTRADSELLAFKQAEEARKAALSEPHERRVQLLQAVATGIGAAAVFGFIGATVGGATNSLVGVIAGASVGGALGAAIGVTGAYAGFG